MKNWKHKQNISFQNAKMSSEKALPVSSHCLVWIYLQKKKSLI